MDPQTKLVYREDAQRWKQSFIACDPSTRLFIGVCLLLPRLQPPIHSPSPLPALSLICVPVADNQLLSTVATLPDCRKVQPDSKMCNRFRLARASASPFHDPIKKKNNNSFLFPLIAFKAAGNYCAQRSMFFTVLYREGITKSYTTPLSLLLRFYRLFSTAVHHRGCFPSEKRGMPVSVSRNQNSVCGR